MIPHMARREATIALNDLVEEERLLTPREVASLLGATHDWVLDQWQAGVLPGFRLTERMVRFRPSEIRLWLETRRSGPPLSELTSATNGAPDGVAATR